jgi:signal transduction histidine kinase
MAEYVPATLLVSNNLDILFFRGQVNPYLTHEPGTASLNVTKMVRKELRTNVQTSVYLARKENKTQKETVQFKSDGEQKSVIIQVKPMKAPDYEEPFFLVTFQEPTMQLDNLALETETTRIPGEKESVKDKQINDLKADLESTKQSLQTIIEVQEATNEELRSTMEEAQSSNEELQSTNEELETAKEELQSGNEELQTLNEELKNRNLALGRLNDDLANLQTNLDIAVVIVDSSLRIRRFTAAAQDLLRISPSDVGGSIANLTPGVHIQNLDKTVTDVIDKLTPVSQEVEGLEGSCYEMRVRPYLTENKRIDGAFLSFTDITKRKKAEEALDKYTKNLEKLVEDRTKQLKDSERMAAIGQTAGMVGHDIRNPLQAILSDLYLAKSELTSLTQSEAKESLGENLASIETEVGYINKVVQDLQDFAKPVNPTVEEVDLEKLFEETVSKRELPENMETSCKVGEGAKKILTDPTILKRSLTNLVNNAVQAMPDGGKLSLEAHKDGADVVLTVTDTGIGIPEAVKAKLFTPLFTTKSKGQGFGLAAVKRLIQALGGTITFESEVGKGTTFMVRLPAPQELNGK